MADIEDRARKWARAYAKENGLADITGLEDVLVDAYLAGVAQTQQDYSRHAGLRAD